MHSPTLLRCLVMSSSRCLVVSSLRVCACVRAHGVVRVCVSVCVRTCYKFGTYHTSVAFPWDSNGYPSLRFTGLQGNRLPSCDGIVSGSSGIVESVNCLNRAYYIII